MLGETPTEYLTPFCIKRQLAHYNRSIFRSLRAVSLNTRQGASLLELVAHSGTKPKINLCMLACGPSQQQAG